MWQAEDTDMLGHSYPEQPRDAGLNVSKVAYKIELNNINYIATQLGIRP